MTERNWVFGNDIGTRCWALSFANESELVVEKLMLIDLCIDVDVQIDVLPTNAGRVIYKWIKSLAPHFNRCNAGGIEIQPPVVGVPIMKTVQIAVECCIRCLYPHIDVYLTDPKKVRKWLDTSGGKYKDRKNKSVMAPVISAHDRKRMLKLFRKDTYSKKTKKWTTKPKIDDVIEASQIALYVITHKAELAREAAVIKGVPTTAPAMYLMERVQLYLPPPREEGEGEEEPPKTKKKRAAKKEGAAPPKKRVKKSG